MAVTTGGRLPELQDRALDGSVVKLPDSARGFVTLVGFGFRRESQYPLETWMKPFAAEFTDPQNFRHYEVPMMGRGLVRLARGMINRGMKQGTSETEHRFVVPFYGDIKSYARELGMDTKKEHVFVYLLDREGTIRWHGQGAAQDSGLAELFETARGLE
ncbi:MAG: hypothetical protein JSU73_08075 [candidate division WOR-3 bacterium]|nr:MAG: hypothetical protein JSU73_08075 [candidate division WOR-3 bacterium]